MFDYPNRSFNLPWIGGSITPTLSQSSWNFSLDENIYSGGCFSDTIVVEANVVGYFNEPISGVQVLFRATSISYNCLQ